MIGVDNDELMCELTNPPLSSVELGTQTIGYQAAALLDRLMAGEKPSQLKHAAPPEGIVARRSSNIFAIEDADVAAALQFIREKACSGIQVHDVVRSVSVSRSTLEVRFKVVTGRTMHAEIQRVRVNAPGNWWPRPTCH